MHADVRVELFPAPVAPPPRRLVARPAAPPHPLGVEKDCDAVLWLDADVVAQRRCVALPVVTAPIRFSVDPHGTGLFLARRDAIPVFADVLRRRHSFATSGTPTQSALKAHYRERGGAPSLFPASFVSYGLGPNASTAPFWHVTGNRHVKRKRFRLLARAHDGRDSRDGGGRSSDCVALE